jgi:hypothetical protein
MSIKVWNETHMRPQQPMEGGYKGCGCEAL